MNRSTKVLSAAAAGVTFVVCVIAGSKYLQIASIVTDLKSDNASVREAALVKAEELELGQVVPYLVESLAAERNCQDLAAAVRYGYLESLEIIEGFAYDAIVRMGESSSSFLRGELFEPDCSVRCWAVTLLGEMGPPESAIGAIEGIAIDTKESIDIRYLCVHALSKAPRALSHLRNVVRVLEFPTGEIEKIGNRAASDGPLSDESLLGFVLARAVGASISNARAERVEAPELSGLRLEWSVSRVTMDGRLLRFCVFDIAREIPADYGGPVVVVLSDSSFAYVASKPVVELEGWWIRSVRGGVEEVVIEGERRWGGRIISRCKLNDRGEIMTTAEVVSPK